MKELLYVVALSIGSVVYLFFISKLSGKKQIAQINFIDFVLAISIGSIAANMATDTTDTPFYHYLIAMAVFFVFNIVIVFLERKGTMLKDLINGSPIMIIYQGKINYKALKKSKLDMNDLIALARNKDYFDLSDIEYAIFETNGQLSILPKGGEKPVVVSDVGAQIEPSSLVNYLVIDGNISYSGLNEAGKTEQWLFDQLNVTNKKQLKQILMVTFDEQNDSVFVTKKSQ